MQELTIVQLLYKEEWFDDHERKSLQPLVKQFLDAFNVLALDVFSNSKLGERAKSFLGKNFLEPLGMESPASVLFPSLYSGGNCGKGLVHLLMEKHNIMIHAFAQDQERPLLVSPRDVSGSEELVCFDERSLQLTLLSSLQYSLEVNAAHRGTQWTLDEDALEKSVVEM